MISYKPISAPLCPIHSVHFEQVVHVCIEPTCSAQSLLCMSCQKQNLHSDHQSIPIGKFIHDICNLQYDQTIIETSSSLQAKLKGQQRKCLEAIQGFKEKIMGQLKAFESATVDYFEGLLSQQKKQLDPLKINFSTEVNWDSPFEIINDQINEKRKLLLTKKGVDINALAQFKRIESESENKSKRLNDTINSVQSEVAKIFRTYQQPETINFGWSQKLKHKCLKINGNRVNNTDHATSRDSVCCLGDWETGTILDLSKWSIKILNIQKWLFIGICDPKLVIQNNFERWSWNKNGHGNYAICNDGYVYSDSDEQINNKMIGFSYQKGDVIKMEFNYQRGMLTFIKNEKKIEMIVKTDRKYRVLACLGGTGTQIELGQW